MQGLGAGSQEELQDTPPPLPGYWLQNDAWSCHHLNLQITEHHGQRASLICLLI